MAGGITVAAGVGAAFVLPPLLSTAGAAPGASPGSTVMPSVEPTPVISATPIPERRRTLDTEAMTPELEAEIWEREGPRGTAIDQVRTTFPEDYAFGYITDEGFGMSFKAEAPPEALAILDAVGDPYELHEYVGFTELDAEPQLSRAVEMVQEAVGKQGMSAGVNFFTVTVEVALYPDSVHDGEPIVLDQAELEQLEDAIRPELYPGFDITITSVPDVEPGW